MKFILYLFFILALYAHPLLCQTFEKVYRTSEDELVYDAVMVDSTSCIFALNSGNNFTGIYYTKFFKIDLQSGFITDSLIIEPETPGYFFTGIFDVLKVNDSLFIGIGSFGLMGSSEQIQYIVHLDNHLQILYDTIIDIPDIVEISHKTIITENSKLVTVGKIANSVDYKRILCEKTLYGDSIRYETYSHPGSFTASTVLDIPHKNKYHMFIYGGIEKAINIIDKNTLERDTIMTYPTFFLPNDAVRDDKDSSIYYVAGREGSDDLSYLKINDYGEILNQYVFDLASNAFYTYKCISPCNEYLFFGGVYPFTLSPPTLYPEPRWILLYKLTKEGEIVWQKFYKGEVNYMVYKILATKDGGALLFSTKYDWNDPIPDQRDVHILKIDSTGYYDPITATEEVLLQMNKQILVYPNPAINEVNFVLGLYSNLQLSIYNSTGERMIFQSLYHSQTIDISCLSPGIYIYLLTGKNGFTETGKIIKY
jgi:hypothetical protein